MECLRLLIENNSVNASLFRQHGGSKYTHELIPHEASRPFALKIFEQLIVDGGHEDLGMNIYGNLLCFWNLNPINIRAPFIFAPVISRTSQNEAFAHLLIFAHLVILGIL